MPNLSSTVDGLEGNALLVVNCKIGRVFRQLTYILLFSEDKLAVTYGTNTPACGA